VKAVVLAAGKGTRMMPLTKDKPKALVEYKGRPLIEWVLESLEKGGVEKAGIVMGPFGEKIVERFGSGFGKLKLSYLLQASREGTAKALENAREFSAGERFLCVNGDVIVEPELFKALMEKKGFDAVISVRRVQDYERFGVVRVEGGQVKEIIEKPAREAESELINLGVYCFSPKIFEAIERTEKSPRGELELTDSIRLLIEGGGNVGFIEWTGEWKDIGTLADLEK